MKIDTNTINVLKNFAKINSSIVISEGNVLKTIAPSKTIMAKATVTTEFPKRFAVYNLDELLSVHSLFTDPEVTFKDSYIELREGNLVQRYMYSDENTVTKAPDKELVLPSIDATFTLTNEDLKKVEKAAGVLRLPELVISGDGTTLRLSASDVKNPTSNEFSIEVGQTDKTFKAVFKIENIKVIAGDYEVSISARGISHFAGKDAEYWIAIEQSSSFA